jgi:DNA topoisomerase-1
MEESLDSVKRRLQLEKPCSRIFYNGFEKTLEDAETALEANGSKSPTRFPTRCATAAGRQMVVKAGRFGRFLACPGYPECSFTNRSCRNAGQMSEMRQPDTQAYIENGYTIMPARS